MSIISIPLSKLIPSAFNVRKTGGESLDDLAASIAVHGLIQCLNVRPAEGGKYEVVAGGRRLAAMKRLAKEKLLAKSFPVPCRVLEGEDATEISLAENQIRQAMHPADQFDAFKALSDGGMGTAEIAARFGVPERMVEQRLKLASVSPALFALYRADRMTLEQLMAFTVSDDHDRQEAVWKMLSDSYDRSTHAIRRHLTDSKVPGYDSRALLIGEDAYLAAGGAVTRDLFADERECFFEDAALLDRLVAERLEQEAARVLAEGWAWVEIVQEAPHRFYAPVPALLRDFTEDEQAEMDSLTALTDSGSEEEEARHDELCARIDALEASRHSFPDEMKAQSGALIRLERDGAISIARGYVRREANDNTAPMARDKATPPKPKPEHSAALLAELTAHRTMALRVGLAENPAVALDALLWTLAGAEFGTMRPTESSLQIRADGHFPGERNVTESKAAEAMDALREQWGDRLPGEGEALWHWLQAADQSEKLALLAFMVAGTLNAVQSHGQPTLPISDRIHRALGLEMAEYWQPTAENYLSRVPAEKIRQAVRDAVSITAADALTGLKKARLAAQAEKKLAGTGWLPTPLRMPEAADEAAMPEIAEAAILGRVRTPPIQVAGRQELNFADADRPSGRCWCAPASWLGYPTS